MKHLAVFYGVPHDCCSHELQLQEIPDCTFEWRCILSVSVSCSAKVFDISGAFSMQCLMPADSLLYSQTYLGQRNFEFLGRDMRLEPIIGESMCVIEERDPFAMQNPDWGCRNHHLHLTQRHTRNFNSHQA